MQLHIALENAALHAIQMVVMLLMSTMPQGVVPNWWSASRDELSVPGRLRGQRLANVVALESHIDP